MYSVLPALVAFLFLGYGLYVVARKGFDSVSISFLVLCVATFAWQGTWAALFQARDPETILFLVKAGYLLIIFLPTAMYHFLVEVTGRTYERKVVCASYALASVFAVMLVTTDLVIAGYYEYFWGAYPKAGVLHPLYLVYTIAAINRGLYITYMEQKTAPPAQRTKLRYCVTALLIYFFAAVDFLCNYGVEFYPPGVLFTLVALGIIAVAMVKHRLMDVSVAISRGIAKLLVIGVLGLAYLGSYLAAQIVFPAFNLWSSLAFNFVFLIFACELYGPLSHYLQSVPNLIVLANHKTYRYSQVVNRLAQALGSHITLPGLFRNLITILETHAHIKPVTVFLRGDFVGKTSVGGEPVFMLWDNNVFRAQHDNSLPTELVQNLQTPSSILFFPDADAPTQEILRQYNADVAISVELRGQIACILLLGKHETYTHYTHDDLNLFDYLSRQLALALDNVYAYAQLSHRAENATKIASLITLMNEYHHEVKAPIGIIDMYARSSYDIDVIKREIIRQCDRAYGLLGKMLRILQSDRGRKEQPVNINELAETALKMFPLENSSISLKLEKSLPMILGDYDDLLILFINLFKNSIEACHDAGHPVMLSVETHSQTLNRKIIIDIQDGGAGISGERLDKIWSLSFTTKQSGTGMGLKVVRRIVDEHRGDIKISSRNEKGLSVRIMFPAIPDVQPDAGTSAKTFNIKEN
jgi:signal transduction histidine kinase